MSYSRPFGQNRGKFLLFFLLTCLFPFDGQSQVIVYGNRHGKESDSILSTAFSENISVSDVTRERAGFYNLNTTQSELDGLFRENSVENNSSISDLQLFEFPTSPIARRYHSRSRSNWHVDIKPESFSLRANLLSWVVFTPDLGVEWIINRDLGLILDGSWTSLKWGSNNGYRFAVWSVKPEFRYYLGNSKQWFVGLYYMMGDYNFRFSKNGYQGRYQGGGFSLGYLQNLGDTFSLDFHIGVGYIFSNADKYQVWYGYNTRLGKEIINYPGVNQLGVTLVWKLGTNKYQRER